MMPYIAVSIFILFDVATGIIKGLSQGGLNSTPLRKGLYHKISELISVVGAGLLEKGMVYLNFGVDIPTLNIVALYICFMELISILENLSEVNPILAKLFKPYLEKLNSQECKNEQ